MGLASSTLEPSPCATTVVRVPCYTLDEKRKKLSKFNTLKKRLSKGKGGFRNHDHGKLLRELTHTWTNEEVAALVEEYATCLNVKELKAQTNLVRSSAPGLKEDLLKLYKEAFCADTTLVFQDFYVCVHKAILSSRCSYFKDLLSQHPQSNPVIHMESKAKGMTKEIFSTLLCYLYTGDFVLKKSNHEYLDVLINLGEEFGTPNVLEQDLKALLSSGEYADVVLVFPGQCSLDSCNSSCRCLLPDCTNYYEIPCHKAILSARSPYFRSLLKRKDLNSVDAGSKKSKCVRLVLDESILTRHYAHAVLQCVYTDSVDLLSVVKWSSAEKRDCGLGAQKRLTPIEIAMELFEVASFIDLPVLMQGCEDIIVGELLSPSTLVPTLKWSCQPHGSAWVYRQAIQFLQEEFVSIAQSESFYLLPYSYLVEALKSDFLQACEHDVLLSVVKWGEAQVARKISDQGPAQDSKKSSKRREIDSKELRKVLSGVIDHVRISHVIPSHSELLESVFRRGLVDRGMPLDIGEGNFYPNLPWMRRREEKDFVRPRLFLPYYEEAKAILQERRQIEKEQGRQRMSRASYNMPDTLYMLEPQKRVRRKTEPSSNLRRTAAALGRLDLGTGHATVQTSRWHVSDSEFERTGRANSLGAGEGGLDGTDKIAVRQFGLPDLAMELPSRVRDEYWETEASCCRRHPFGVEEAEPVLSPVPDVALPSSPTPSVSSGVPLEYLRMGQSREPLDDVISNGSS